MTLEEKQRRAEKALKLYHDRRLSGICVACGINPPIEGILRCSNCRTKRNITSQKQKKNRPAGYCRQCCKHPAIEGLSSCKYCHYKRKIQSKAHHAEIRLQVIKRYGGACACCGTTITKYLQLDHKNNDGNVERKSLPPDIRGGKFFQLVLRQEKREDLQLLCANCHNAKRYGGCTEEDHEKMCNTKN